MTTENIRNLHLGIPILATKTWLGGLAYIENLAKAVKLLPLSERPKTSFIITDDTLSLFSLNKNSAAYFDELAYVGANPAYATHETGSPVHHFPNLDALFTYLDCYFPVPNSTLPYPNAVSWIPDFQHKRLPQFFTQEELSSRDEQFARIAQTARWLVLSSNSAASDFHTFYPQSQTRLHILHFHTLPPEEWYRGNPSAIQQKYRLPDEFLMCSNQFWTHKDHPTLFKALGKIHNQGKQVHLVCTGSTEDYRTPEYFGQLQQLIHDLGLMDFIHILGTIPREEQIQLVRRSLAMVQPSLFEGWSTVIEDSRALGKTILMSDFPVHIEQAPQNGHYFRQHDADDLAQKLLEILPSLHPGPDVEREETAKHHQTKLVKGFGKAICDLVVEIHNQNISASVDTGTIARRVSKLSQESINRLGSIESRLTHIILPASVLPQAPTPSAAQNDLRSELASLNQQLTYAGDDPSLIVKKGNILIQQGDIEAARRELVKATVIAPQYALGHAMLGLVLVYLKRLDEAEKALRRALVLDPANGTARTLLEEIERSKAAPGEQTIHRAAVVPAENFQDFVYSKRSHFSRFRTFGRYNGIPAAKIDPAFDLKAYQDLLVYNFIIDNIPPGSKLLDVGGGNSRIIQELKYRYECWNADKLEGIRSGTSEIEDTGGFHLVRDYVGNFNRELPDNYFDCVFSISALEHTPEDEATFANILADLDRVLKPGGYSLHTFDIAIFPDRIWTNQLLPYLSRHVTSFLHRVVPFDEMLQDTDIYVMSKEAYEKYWTPVTKRAYGPQSGLPLSYNLLWQKAAVPSSPTEHLAFTPPARQQPTASPGRLLRIHDYRQSPTSAPKLSIVTPSYNQANYLEQTIDSVLSQGYPNLEYIIMDGGSTDGSTEIIKKYRRFLAHWQSAPDNGQYAAIDAGFKHSSGEIMTWLNSDDIFQPNAFNTVVSAFEQFKEVEWLSGRGNNINEAGEMVAVAENLPPWSRQRYLEKNYRDPYIQQEGTFWRRSLWQKAGGCLRTDLRLAGDLELWARFFRHAQLHLVDALLASFRSQPSQKTRSRLEEYFAEAEKILDDEVRLFAQSRDKTLLPAPQPIIIQSAPSTAQPSRMVNTEFLEQTRQFWNVDTIQDAMFNRVVTNENWSRMTPDERKTFWDNSATGSMNQILAKLPTKPDWKILEIGCGVGRVIKPLRERFAQVDGVDISEKMIEYAQQYLAGAPGIGNVFVNNGYDMQMLPSGTYDLVYSIIVFQHIRSMSVVHSYFSEAFRVLKPGGYFRIQVHDTSNPELGTATEEGAGGIQYAFAGNAYTPDQLRDIFVAHGFEDVDILVQSPWIWGTGRRPSAQISKATSVRETQTPSQAVNVAFLHQSRNYWNVDSLEEAMYERVVTSDNWAKMTSEERLEAFTRSGLGSMRQILQDIPAQENWSILEVGCGVGRIIKPMRQRFARVDGVDISEKMIEFARGYLADAPKNGDVFVNNGYDLQMLSSETYHLVFSMIVFQHIRSASVVRSYFNEIYRVLKPGGYFRIQVHDTSHASMGRVDEEGQAGVQYQMDGNCYSPDDLKALFLRHGFEVLDIDHQSPWVWGTARRPLAQAGDKPTPYLVSAIVSTYKSEEFMRGCLEDLERQTIADKLEIIVVDSASPQNERAIVEEFQQRYNNIVYLRTDEREPLYTAWNRAIRMAHGKYLTSANTDDRHRRDALEVMANTLEANPQIALVYADQVYTPFANETLETTQSRKQRVWAEYSYQTLRSHCMVSSQPMWRRALHERYGWFDESFRSAGDWEFWLRIGKTEQFQKINQVLGLYYDNPQGIENVNREVLKEASRVHRMYNIHPEELSESTYTDYNPQPDAASTTPPSTRSEPRISVIIPCYNYGHYLSEALDSVVSQTFRNYEIIIVNDGSTDNSKEVASAYIQSHPQERIRLINQPNSGHPALARNSGISQAAGEYIVCLDPDDRFAPTYLEKAVAILEDNPQVGVVYCHIQEFGDRNDIYYCGHFNLETLARDNVLPYCALVRRSIWQQVGGYKVIPYEDWDYWIGICELGWQGVLIPETLFFYRKHGSSRLSGDKSQHDLAVAKIVLQHPRTYDEATRDWAAGLVANPGPGKTERGPVLIALSHFHPSIGGLETIAENLGEQLVNLGYQVEVATWKRPERTSNVYKGMRILSLDEKPMMNNIPQWMLLLRDLVTSGKYRACIIMADPLNPFIWTVENAQLPPSTRMIIQPLINKDGYRAWKDDPAFRQRLSAILKSAAALALTRNGVEVNFMQEEGISPIYLPNAVAPPPPSLDFRQKYNLMPETFMLLHVANLWSVKNHLALLQTLQNLPPDWKLVMIGHPSGEPDYVAQVQEELRHRPDVLYLPGLPPEEVSAAMQAANVILLASKGEVSPVTIMEAMYHAKPWLATPECGSVHENAGGIIAPLDQFVTILNILYDHTSIAQQLGAAGHAHWQASYAWPSVIRGWEELIETGRTQRDFAMPSHVAEQMEELRSQVNSYAQGISEQVISPIRIPSSPSDQPLTFMVEINGLRADFIPQMPFLNSIVAKGACARFLPGLNFIPRPGFFAGLTPAQFGFSHAFCHDPQHSPFNLGRHLPPGLTHLSQVEEDRSRQVFNHFVPGERITAYAAGHLQKYEIPLEYLPYFDITDPRPPWDRRVSYASLFSSLKHQSIPWYQLAAPYRQDYLPSDSEVINEVFDKMPPNTRFAYIQLMELDNLAKISSPDSQEVIAALEILDENLKGLADYLHTGYSQVNFLVVGVHGMVPVHHNLDVWAALENSGLKYGIDYAFFLDPTLARFWFYNANARVEVQKTMTKLKGIRAMTPANLKAAGIDGCDARNGELFYLASPGTVIFPNFRQRRGEPPRATHGYGINCREDDGIVLLKSSHKKTLPEKLHSHEIYRLLVDFLGIKPEANG